MKKYAFGRLVMAMLGVNALCFAGAASASTLFQEDFESGLSAPSANWFSNHSGVAAVDPLQSSNHALAFNTRTFGGDLFSQAINATSGDYVLSFDYLGTCGGAGDCGGFIGYATPGNLPNSEVWLASSSPLYPDKVALLDTGTWQHLSISFTGPTPVALVLEQWDGSAGAAHTAYFDNIVVTGTNTPVPVPAAFWLFGSALAGLVGMKKKLGS